MKYHYLFKNKKKNINDRKTMLFAKKRIDNEVKAYGKIILFQNHNTLSMHIEK